MKIQHVCEISGLGTHVVLAKVCNIENKYKKTLESWQSLFFSTELLFIILISAKSFNVGFHLNLLVFPFVYQFNSRIVAVHHLQMTSSEEFQHHFKICLLWFLHTKKVAFTLIYFAVLI